tara:strand:+ start:1331 stop:1822 length:492 start_codon:yes stop_codon:yes gene_type:complete
LAKYLEEKVNKMKEITTYSFDSLWFDILKAPLIDSSNRHAVPSRSPSTPLLLQFPREFLSRTDSKRKGNQIWESQDENALAKVRIEKYKKGDKLYPYWAILAFEIKGKKGAGRGEKYVREMREELQNEKDIPLVGGSSYQNWSKNFWLRMERLGLMDWVAGDK